jgi:hypothetical protein
MKEVLSKYTMQVIGALIVALYIPAAVLNVPAAIVFLWLGGFILIFG